MTDTRASLRQLRSLFEHSITAKDIAEPVVSFDEGDTAIHVRRLMEDRDYDVVGVREDGAISAFASRDSLGDGTLMDYKQEFSADIVLDDTAPLKEVAARLTAAPWLFATAFGSVGGIITRADMQKTPVRMWMFGLVSILEMEMQRAIGRKFPNEEWQSLLNANRLEMAERLFQIRSDQNESLDLLDCLQLADKITIFEKTDSLFNATGVQSKKQFSRDMRKIEKLRNRLAHSRELSPQAWPSWAECLARGEDFLSGLQGAISP